jgi:intein/homing endonuclease
MNTKEIILEYKKGKSIRNISKISNIPTYKISNILKENNIKIISNVEKLKKYKINENYFDIIDNEHKAYTLGFLYADGYNNEKKNIVKISLQENDIDILNKIKEPICPDKPLRYYIYKNNINRKPQYSFVIDNSHISKKLSKLGVVQAKTFKIDFPNYLDDRLIKHFIRGYFDGDGCITCSSPKKYPNKFNYYISFVSTDNFIKKLQKYFKTKMNISIKKTQTRYTERNNNIRTITISGNLQVEKVLNHLYDNSTIFLQRKYDKYLELKNINLLKYSKNQ